MRTIRSVKYAAKKRRINSPTDSVMSFTCCWAIVAPAKQHLAILERHQAMVADGTRWDIAAQVGDHCWAEARFLHRHPGCCFNWTRNGQKALVSQEAVETGTAQRSLGWGRWSPRDISPKDLGGASDRKRKSRRLVASTLTVWTRHHR